MVALAASCGGCAGHVGRPLADLAADVERVMGMDIEVAARPGADPVAAGADLDAFIDVADEFAGEGAERPWRVPGLPDAAEQEEFGLETGRVGESDPVSCSPCTRPRACNGRPCSCPAWPRGSGPRSSRPSPASRRGGRITRG